MLVELSVKLMVIVHVKSMSLEKIAMSAYQEHGICCRPMNWVVKVSIFKLLHSMASMERLFTGTASIANFLKANPYLMTQL